MKRKNISILMIIIIILLLIIGVGGLLIFFNKKEFKNEKIGNNITNQEIVDYILNINNFETKIEVEVQSNKNINKYIMKQKYTNPNTIIQEVIEPSNIAGVKITKSENQLKIENTKLNLNTIFTNYQYISDNCLDLNSFINDYKQDQNAKWIEEENQIVMIAKNEKKDKKLYIDKNTSKPVKLVIQDVNQNATIYILYNEIDIKK